MQEFLATVASFPTIVFSFALGVVLLYWLVVIFGALDLDFLDTVLGIDAVDSAFEGGVESLEGIADGAAEGAADALEAADGDLSDDSFGGLLAGILNVMGVRGIPVTVVGTFIIFWAWILSYLATRFFGSLAATAIFGLIIALASVLAACVLAAMTTRPFRKLFITQLAPRRASLVGKTCTILSAHVDDSFGRGEINDGGAGFVAEVRCPGDNDLVRGSEAIVYRYEADKGTFFVGPMDPALADAARFESNED